MQDTSDLPDISPLTATASVDNTSTSESSGGSTGGPADLDLTESIHHHTSTSKKVSQVSAVQFTWYSSRRRFGRCECVSTDEPRCAPTGCWICNLYQSTYWSSFDT